MESIAIGLVIGFVLIGIIILAIKYDWFPLVLDCILEIVFTVIDSLSSND